MQADTVDSSASGASSATNEYSNIRFRPAAWLRRWAANGNEVHLLPGGALALFYGDGGNPRERDRLEILLTRRKAVPTVRSYMVLAGIRRIGALA